MTAPDRIHIFQVEPDMRIAADVGGAGGGATVVLMHGGGQTRQSWAGEFERLVAMGYRGISYDARGHGESGWAADGNYSFDRLSADLAIIVRDAVRPLVLVGASMGGLTALYAVAGGLVADALVLVDVVPRPGIEGVKKILSFMQANPDGFVTIDDAIDAVTAYNPERGRLRNPEGMMRNLRRRENGRLYWHWDPRVIDGKSPEDNPDLDLAVAAAASITIPTLLIRGGRSDVVTDESVAELRDLIPHLEVFEVRSAGHMVAGDDNSTFHTGIAEFLDQHFPIGRRV